MVADGNEFVVDRAQWETMALSSTAHLAAQLSGIVQHVRRETDAADDRNT